MDLVLGAALISVLRGLFHLCGLGYRSQRQPREGQDCPKFVWSSPGEAVNGVTALPEHSNPGLDLGGFL